MSRKKTPSVVTITLEQEDLERIFTGQLDRMPELQRKLTDKKVKKSKNKGDIS